MAWLHNHRHRLLSQRFYLQQYLSLLERELQRYVHLDAVGDRLRNHLDRATSHQESAHVV